MGENSDCDQITFLLSTNFSTLSLEQKLEIKGNRQTPAINLSQQDGRIQRKFQLKWYQQFPWLTGSAQLNRLFCFPCLLFGGAEPAWSREGINIIKKLL